MSRFLSIVVRRPGWVLAFVLAVTALAVTRVVDPLSGEILLPIDPAVDSMLPSDDEERVFYESVRRIFGSDETLIVAVGADDVFRRESLDRIVRLTRRIEEVRGVHHVVSLATARRIRGQDGDIAITPFFRDVPGEPAELERLRRDVLADPLYAGSLVSLDAKTAVLIVHLDDVPERELLARGVVDEIRGIAEQERGDAQVWVTGGIVLKAATSRILLSDLARTLPLAILVVALVSWASFRSGRGVLIPLATTGVALAWTLGFMAAVGGTINLVTAVVPPLVLVVGFAYSVHVVSEYMDAVPHAEDPVLEALEQVSLPVVLTAGTTAAGFVSLMTSPIGAVRQFGAYSTVGVLSTMVVSLTFVPAMLRVLPVPKRRSRGSGRDRMDRALERLAGFDLRHRRPILLAGAAVALVAVVGTARIRVSTDFMGAFAADHPVRRDFMAINERLDGASVFHVVLEASYRDAFKEPETLEEMEKLQAWLESQPEIGATTSLVEYVKLIHRSFHDDDPEQLVIPASKRMTSQLLHFAAIDELERFVDSHYRTASILVRARSLDSQRMADLVERIEGRLASLPDHLRARVTGNGVIVSRALDDIAYGQAVSLGTAFLIIYTILCLLFTSARVGFIALIPNALPVLAYFGILGLSGVSLNPTTGLVACLVLGIAVDDTIHFLARFNSAAHRLADESRGVVEALRTVGRPVTTTSAALCLGFLVLTSSELRNQAEFGMLASVTLALAWLVDVTFTPALSIGMRVVTLWDALTLDLGEDPHRSIPLFDGLKKTQARIVALLGQMRDLPAGERLIRAGDEGQEMFVVIEGELVASLETERGPVEFGRLGRGEVVGEVALFHGRRTADVHAVSDTRLLSLTDRDLERIRRRYPRTGAQLYRNVSKALAHHVATTTARVG